MERGEVQSHGFSWEKDIIMNVFHVTKEEMDGIKYTSKMDLPARLNKLDGCDLSIKTTCKENMVCMADCLRIFDSVRSNNPIHMIVIYYSQDDLNKIKVVQTITEIDLTDSCEILFGSLTRTQIEDLDKMVKTVPKKRKPTEEEYKNMYSLRDSLQELSGAIHLDIKCNSSQSRLQCSFNHFQQFIHDFPTRVIARSFTNEFRGRFISPQISSSRRSFKKKQKV